MRRVSTLCTLALLLCATAASAAIPRTISYQGLLRDAGGTIVADGNYSLTFRIYAAASGGSALWTETQTLAVQDGVFNAVLGSITPITQNYNSPYWLGISVQAEAELTPRIALAAAPYSLNADRLDGLSSADFAGDAHTHALDALSDVNAAAPTSGQVLTFSAGAWEAQTPVAGGDDWDNVGGDIQRPTGKVFIGPIFTKPAAPDTRIAERFGRNAYNSKLRIYAATPADESGIYAVLDDADNTSDERAAIYGLRNSSLLNPGVGFGPAQTNNAITGFNAFGDNYSFGVAGYTYFDNPHTAGVFGSNEHGNLWGALAYRDADAVDWGVYTPSRAYFGGGVGIGIDSPVYPLQVNGPAGTAILGQVTFVGPVNYSAIWGWSVPAFGYGIGGRFTGGNTGAVCEVISAGGGSSFGVHASVGGMGTEYGVYGGASGTGTNYGIYGFGAGGTTNYAGYFQGNVHVNGTLSKAAGAFKIDHPLDPASKTLSHSFVESPDMKNVYDGTVVLGADGTAWVEMPVWFEALNRDFRYQLTAVGAPGPNLYVAEKVTGNRFKIAGGQAGLEVSWQLTGIRQDAYANAHRIPVEEVKVDQESGRYLHPELFGRPESEAIGHTPPREVN